MKQALYFCHGAPGSPSDADLGFAGRIGLPPVMTPDLFADDTPGTDTIKSALAQFDSITRKIPDGRIHVVGFSIGAMVAAHIAAARPERLMRLTLVSPAAPLQLGDFLPQMAGQPVFRLAARHPGLFSALTYGQGVLTRAAPDLLIRRLFASADRSEHALLENPNAAKVIRKGLRHSFSRHPKGYARMIAAYVSDWSPVLGSILCPVDIWQGTADRWVPLAMAQALARPPARQGKPAPARGGGGLHHAQSPQPVRGAYADRQDARLWRAACGDVIIYLRPQWPVRWVKPMRNPSLP